MSASGTGGSGNTSSGGKSSGSGGATTMGGSAQTGGGGGSGDGECGNGKREGSEECDDGNQEDNDGCTNDCAFQCEDCACDTCMGEKCSAYDASGAGNFEDLIAACYEAAGNATQGPSLGIAKKTLCGDVVACVRGSGCAEQAEGIGLDSEMCYCGVPFIECLEDAVDGECKETFELAAESSEYEEVMERFSDSGYALGLGVALVRCQSEFCAADCGLKVE
jgi:cysteine-rich repeat protein